MWGHMRQRRPPRVIFRFGLWPAALELWGVAPSDRRAGEWEKARWKDGQLIMPGLTPLTLAAVAAKAHAQNSVTAAIAHGFNRRAWSRATFSIDGEPWTADIDALAVRHGGGDFVRLDRTSVKFPPTDFNRIGTSYASLCGTAVRVEIKRATGALRIAKAYSVFIETVPIGPHRRRSYCARAIATKRGRRRNARSPI